MAKLAQICIDGDCSDTLQIDASLSVAGYAADARATGQALAGKAPMSAVGGPNIAATASAMTDTNKIYVYTGSESGYSNGHWYYYNGSTWTDGGVYQAAAVNTDTTLTQSGVPADAKATGDEISELKNDLTELEQEGYPMASITEAVEAWAENNNDLFMSNISESAKDYDMINIFATAGTYGTTGSDLQGICKLSGSADYWALQGGTYNSNKGHFVACIGKIVSNEYTDYMLVEFGKDFETVYARKSGLSLGHGNDMAYCPGDDCLYITDTSGKINVYNATTLEYVKQYSVPNNEEPIGIAYSTSGDRIYILTPTSIKVVSRDFENVKTYPNIIGASYTGDNTLLLQGIEYCDGKLLCTGNTVTALSSGQSHITTFVITLDTEKFQIVNVSKWRGNGLTEPEFIANDGSDVYVFFGHREFLVNKLYIARISDAEQNERNIGTSIPSNSDLNDYIVSGKYYTLNGSISSTIANIPSGLNQGFTLYVHSMINTFIEQRLITLRGQVYYRTAYFSGNYERLIWLDWQLSYGLNSNQPLGSNVDLNSITMVGTYHCLSTATAATISNIPVSTAFKLIVENSRGQDSGESIFRTQRFISISYGEYVRYYTGNAWTNWQYISAPYSLESYFMISQNDDLNDYTTVGTYSCQNAATAESLSNCPTNGAFKLIVENSRGRDSGEYIYRIQRIITNTGIEFTRYLYNGVFSSWGKVNANINVANYDYSVQQLNLADVLTAESGVTVQSTSFAYKFGPVIVMHIDFAATLNAGLTKIATMQSAYSASNYVYVASGRNGSNQHPATGIISGTDFRIQTVETGAGGMLRVIGLCIQNPS